MTFFALFLDAVVAKSRLAIFNGVVATCEDQGRALVPVPWPNALIKANTSCFMSNRLDFPQSTIASIVFDECTQILTSMIAGARYGIKIRLPHAAVMTVLFRKDMDAKEKLQNVIQLTLEHATNLAAFATIYKTILATLKWLSVLVRNRTQDDGIFTYLGRSLLSIIGKKN